MIPILVLKTANKVIYNKSNLNCKTFFEEFISPHTWETVLGLRPVLISTFPCLGLELCTKSMGLSFLCQVLISAPLVSNPANAAGKITCQSYAIKLQVNATCVCMYIVRDNSLFMNIKRGSYTV